MTAGCSTPDGPARNTGRTARDGIDRCLAAVEEQERSALEQMRRTVLDVVRATEEDLLRRPRPRPQPGGRFGVMTTTGIRREVWR